MDDKSFNIRVPKKWARIGLVVLVTAIIVAPLTALASHQFTDVPDSNIFHGDIAWLADAGVTKGCNPPTNDQFCPKDPVTREAMGAFMHRFAQYIDAEDGTPGVADMALALPDEEAFHLIGDTGEPAFQNSWANFGLGWSDAGFYIDHQNVVHLKGTVTGGASGTTAFTLPAAYRPTQSLFLAVADGDYGYVMSNGAVQFFYANNTHSGDIGIDGISFRVGAGGSSEAPTGFPGS